MENFRGWLATAHRLLPAGRDSHRVARCFCRTAGAAGGEDRGRDATGACSDGSAGVKEKQQELGLARPPLPTLLFVRISGAGAFLMMENPSLQSSADHLAPVHALFLE